MAERRNKIVLISVTKIESDILESFLRHSLGVVDEILLADNGSADGAAEILKKMVQEGLPITVQNLRNIEFDHAEVMNHLLEEAIARHHADIVLPLDVDEFLLCDDGEAECRNILRTLDPHKAYRLPWRRCTPRESYTPSMGFLLDRECLRDREWRKDSKVVVGAGLFQEGIVRLVSGCHHVYRVSPQGAQGILETPLSRLHVAHFHWRSCERYRLKIMVGHLGTTAKYGEHSASVVYSEEYKRYILNGEDCTREKVIGEALEPFSPISCCTSRPLQYSADARTNPLPLLMQDGVRLAEAYAELRTLQRKEMVDILIPCWGNLEELKKSLNYAKNQVYPYKTVYVCDMGKTQNPMVSDIIEEQDGSVLLLASEDGSFPCEILSQKSSGKYVQWLLPGGRIPPNHLQQMITCMESQDLNFSMMLENRVSAESELAMDTDLCRGTPFRIYPFGPLWKHLLTIGRYPADGMDALLIRRELMDEALWLRDCLTDDAPHPLEMWIELLRQEEHHERGLILGAFPGEESAMRQWSVDDFLDHQLQWGRLLAKYQEKLTEEEREDALENLLQERFTAAKYAPNADIEKLRAYRDMIFSFVLWLYPSPKQSSGLFRRADSGLSPVRNAHCRAHHHH